RVNTTRMRNLLVLFGICVSLAGAQEIRFQNDRSHIDLNHPGKNLWRASISALAVANVLDVHSSWGKRELNPALTNSTGRFGRDGALLKLGFQGGLIGVEYLITRGHPTGKLYRALSFINFGAAATVAGTAAHNYTIPRR